MNTSTKEQKLELKSNIYFIGQCYRSPIGHIYLECIDHLYDSEFYWKSKMELFPKSEEIIYAAVWKIWQNLGEPELNLSFTALQYYLLQFFDQQIEELSKEYDREFLHFIQIIIKFADKARLRLTLLQHCNSSDWLRVQWHVFKRNIRELIGKELPMNWEQKREEDQLVYCSRVMNDLKKNDKGIR